LICETHKSLPIRNHRWSNENSNHYETFVEKDSSNDVFRTILHIENINESDNGNFECFVENGEGSDKKKIELLVQTAAKVDVIVLKDDSNDIEVDGVVNVLEDDEVTFDCIVDGFPHPDVSWFKGQDEAKLNRNDSTITSRVRQEDAENYRCVARNILGLATKSFTLKVNSPPKSNNLEAELLKGVENDNVQLRCDFRGNPEPEISWIFNEKMIEGNDRVELLEDQKLIKFEAHLEDSGVYSCLAVNEFGAAMKNYTILVMGEEN
jgi:hypothetical protein